MSESSLVAGQYGRADLRERIGAALVAAGRDPDRLTVDDTAPIDEFHTLGRAATGALAEAAGITAADHVLDVGAGLGGAARYLADRHGCRVSTVDLTPAYCDVARWLNAATGLADRITVHDGDALALPIATRSIDLVWTQHVQMNVADKAALYREARRVLRDGGRIALWEIVAGASRRLRFPVPWADTPALSYRTSASGLCDELVAAGLKPVTWQDRARPRRDDAGRALPPVRRCHLRSSASASPTDPTQA